MMAASPFTVYDLDSLLNVISEKTPEPCWKSIPSSLPPTLWKNCRASLKRAVPESGSVPTTYPQSKPHQEPSSPEVNNILAVEIMQQEFSATKPLFFFLFL